MRQDDTPFCNRLYDVEIRRVLFGTNAIESLHARYRRAGSARGHFPSEQAALKCLYVVTRGLDRFELLHSGSHSHPNRSPFALADGHERTGNW